MSPATRIKTLFTTALAISLFGGASFSATASDSAAFAEQTLLAQGAQISHHRQTGFTNFIGSRAGNAIALPGTGTPRNASAVAMDALNTYGAMFGLRNPASELIQKSLKTTDNGRSVVRYQQNYNGVPVIGGEMIVNLSPNNGLLSINGEIAPKLTLTTQATINAQQASDTALNAVAKWYQASPTTLNASTPVLSVYDPQLIGPDTFPASLVWRVEVSSTTQQPIRELVLIDALRGAISLHFNQIDSVMIRETYTAAETTANPGTLVCNETDPTCSAGDTDAQSAHQFAKDTYDFYFNTHARDSIDGLGMPIISTTHWNDWVNCPNAFWDGARMIYCTGLVIDDVVAHELTHGVTENTSNLFYYYQSGAINESLSDVWGEFVDLSNTSGSDTTADRWLMGEDATVLGGAIRSMKNPPLYNDPDKMSSANYWTGIDDNGGVHINSGINNKAVYLMVDGDSFNGQRVTGLGIPKVAKIYYEVQTNLLTSGSDYLDLYNALNQGCQNLIGPAGISAADCTQVRNATKAVQMDQQPRKDFNPDASVCPGGVASSTTAFFDDMEGGLTNWTTTWVGWTTTAWHTTYGPYATSGTESLFGEDVASVSDQRAAVTITVPNKNPFLYFKHAFDFETDFDGGVLEYRTNNGSTWTDARGLIKSGQSYNSVLSSLYGNPLGGQYAFSGSSHGYVSTRVDLNGMKGQTVQFRWRVVTDSGVGSLGWLLDDVGVYSCPTSEGGSNSDDPIGFGALGWPFLLLGLLLLPLRRRFRLTV